LASAPLDKVFLQLPGVSQDSIASGSFHIRNEHENVQYRINGVFLPPGVAAPARGRMFARASSIRVACAAAALA
jgi:hypothetical protein